MNDYTKGKWEVKSRVTELGKVFVVEWSGLYICLMPSSVGVDEANARRICRCVNGFDGLLEALKKTTAKLKWPIYTENEKKILQPIIEMAEVTIASAEKE